MRGPYGHRVLFRRRIGRHDGARGSGASGPVQQSDSFSNAGQDAIDRQLDADDACAGDEYLLRPAADGGCGIGGHLYGMRQPVIPGAGVGAAAVDDDGTRPAISLLEMLPRDLYGRSLREIRGEDSRSQPGPAAD